MSNTFDSARVFNRAGVLRVLQRLRPDTPASELLSLLSMWQKGGIAPCSHTGRGNHAVYTVTDVIAFAQMSALQQLGIGPKRAVELIDLMSERGSVRSANAAVQVNMEAIRAAIDAEQQAS